MKTNKTYSTGFPGAFFLVLFVLKVTNTVDWSWLWITAPIWLPFAIVFGFMGLIAFIGFIVMLFSK